MLRRLIFFALLLSRPLYGAPWEVAVMFLGAHETKDYQGDIDRNILELARLKPGKSLRLSLYRELPSRTVSVFVDPASTERHPWDPLFHEVPVRNIPIHGRMDTWARVDGENVLGENGRLAGFFKGAFRNTDARRMLVIYGHGLGFDGLKAVGLKDLKSRLLLAAPRGEGRPLDILWLNACFMATIEVAHEVESVSHHLMASEDAEFSAGAPFETLQEALEAFPDDNEAVARALAESYLTSYSYAEGGGQSGAVHKSSATISVVELRRVDEAAARWRALGAALKALPAGWKTSLGRRARSLRMEREDLWDSGSTLLAMRDLDLFAPRARKPLDNLLALFEMGKRGKLKTNPRILARAPVEDSLLVFGYEDWRRGYEGDEDVLGKLPPNLTPEVFSDGPRRRRWPGRNVRKRLYLTPFSVGLLRFDFFFMDPETHKRLTPLESRVREQDIVTFEAETALNPVRFSGYTQGIGKAAERYSGLAIASPVGGVPSLEYLDLEFYKATRWGEF